ncbi:MAG: hypothetical protein J6Y30_00125 [Treponema sp.]|nr:hypothetical protein [Treponema sp.]
MSEMVTVKTFDAYFYSNDGTVLYDCSVWASSEEEMKRMLKEKFPDEKMKHLAVCETHGFVNDLTEKETSPAPMLYVYMIYLEDVDNVKAKYLNFGPSDFTK